MATPQSVAFHTLGCKLNFAETSALGRQFESAGFQESLHGMAAKMVTTRRIRSCLWDK